MGDTYKNETIVAPNILETALKATESQSPVRIVEEGGEPFILRPANMVREELGELLARPLRVEKLVNFVELESFIDYVNQFKSSDTRIFAVCTESSASVTAIIDYHGSKPSWCSHKAVFNPPPSKEWGIWTSKSRSPFDQESFADFLETNMADVSSPPGATLMEMALNLAIKKDVSFSSGMRLQDGSSQFLYNEDIQTCGGKEGKLVLPDNFILGLAPFDGGQHYSVKARLRYRLNGRKLTFTYELLEVHLVMKDAFKAVRGKISTETSIPVWLGC